MEIVPYLLSVVASLMVFWWSSVNSRRKPGQSVQGLFAYVEPPPPAPENGRAATPR